MKVKINKQTRPATSETSSAKKAELFKIVDTINKQLSKEGNGKVYLGSQHDPIVRIPTGNLAFDYLTGGGLPRRRLTEIYGPESSGKTLLALTAVAATQRQGGLAAWAGNEEFDERWAAKQGVDVKALARIESFTGDTALEMAVSLLETGLLDLMVFDSVQSLGTSREYEGGVDSESYAGGGAPQLWGRVMRRVYSLCNMKKTNAAMLAISQERMPIGKFTGHGAPEGQPTQIKAILHWKSISVQSKKGEPIFLDSNKESKRLLAREFILRCKKNKTAPAEGRVSSYKYNFLKQENVPTGIDYADMVITLASSLDVFERKGGWYVFGKERIQGLENLIKRVRTDKRFMAELTEKVEEAIRSYE